MSGHGVGAERVHDQQSIFTSGRFAQSQTSIAEDYTIPGLHAVAQKREIARVGSDANDIRIDIVEVPLLSLRGVSSDRAGAEAGSGDGLDRRLAVIDLKDLAQWSILVIVRRRLTFPGFIVQLHAVNGAAVIQASKLFIRIGRHAPYTKEVSLGRECLH